MTESRIMDDVKKMSCKEYHLIASFCFINIVNYMDRIGIASVLVKIQTHFAIGDGYGGLLETVLLIALTLSAPFFGYCGDRLSRKWIIIACIIIWTLSTLGGALSPKYWILLLSRLLVGVGQSGFTTISPTVISDVALGSTRSLFLACFYMGIPIGCGLGYVFAIYITDLTGSWRYGLCLSPFLCFIGIILLCFIKFPKRGEKEILQISDTPVKSTTLLQDIWYLLNIPSFLAISAAFTCVCFFTGAVSWWMPKCLFYGFRLMSSDQSNYFLSPSFLFGLVAIVTGLLGVLIGLWLSSYLRKRFPKCDPIICGSGLLIATPFAAGALILIPKSKLFFIICIFISMLNVNMNWAIGTDILLYIVEPIRRTSAQGAHMFLGHTFGDCISPYIVGFLSDYIKSNYLFSSQSPLMMIKKENEVTLEDAAQNFYSLQLSLFITIIVVFFGAVFYFVTSCFILGDIETAKNS